MSGLCPLVFADGLISSDRGGRSYRDRRALQQPQVIAALNHDRPGAHAAADYRTYGRSGSAACDRSDHCPESCTNAASFCSLPGLTLSFGGAFGIDSNFFTVLIFNGDQRAAEIVCFSAPQRDAVEVERHVRSA